jgi:hypothetical protein
LAPARSDWISREVTPIEPERQPSHHHIVGAKPEIAVENAGRRQGGVVAVHHPLRIPRGPRREGHPHHGIGIHGDRHEARRFAARRGDVVETDHARARGTANDADDSKRGQPQLELRRHGGVIEIAERGAADQHFAVGEAHDVFQLAAAEIHADGDRHRAQALQGEEHQCKLDPVRQLDRHHVPGSNAERAQPRRHAIDAVRELAIAEPARSIGQRLAIGRRPNPPRQHGREGLVAPQARAAPARRHRRRQTSCEPHALLPTRTADAITRSSSWPRLFTPR